VRRLVWTERAGRIAGECDGTVTRGPVTYALDAGHEGLLAIVCADGSFVVADRVGFCVTGNGSSVAAAKRTAGKWLRERLAARLARAAEEAAVASLGGGS
jgi:hypothetical protein